MPLGMIAKDSVQDLSGFESSASEPQRRPSIPITSSERRQQFAKEANPQQPPSFQYAGQYSDDYYFNDSYHHHDLDLFPKRHGSGPSLVCCIFPWLLASREKATANGTKQSLKYTTQDEESESKDSSSSNILGERLSNRERQAVLARLRLAAPDQGSPSEEQQQPLKESSERQSVTHKKSLLNGIPVYDSSPLDESVGLKGILKSKSKELVANVSTNSLSKDSVASQPNRRLLFPSTYEGRHATSSKSVSFAQLARVVNIKSRNDMDEYEKGSIWWQRSDYQDFRKTGRVITRAMLEGGGEIWLKQVSTDSSITGDIVSAPGDKWWHKFGHSRRGLEHVVSVDEGRQRQMNVKTAIHSVLEDQERQRIKKRAVDQEKLRSVALHYTSWARDLALASGSSDADAVKSSFANDRRSREYYLIKMSRASPESRKTHTVPEFMRPLSHLGPVTRPILTQNLDANTAAQIQIRRLKSTITSGSQAAQERKAEATVTVHDSSDLAKKAESMAEKAAGFSAENKKIDMAAVLSGMGAAV